MQHFSQSIYEKSAMVTLDPLHQHLLGKAQGLSFWDRKTVSLMYRCDGKCDRIFTALPSCFCL